MAENKKSGILPAQARLLKLKKDLKESKKTCQTSSNQNNQKASSSKSISAQEKSIKNRKSPVEVSNIKKQKASKSIGIGVIPNVSKSSPAKKGLKNEVVALKLKKKLRDQGKICKCKEGSKKAGKKKKGSSNSSDTSPFKSHPPPDKTEGSQSIGDKIRNFFGKFAGFSSNKQKKTPSENNSDMIPKNVNIGKQGIISKKPINFSENCQTNESIHHINSLSSETTKSPLESLDKSKKTSFPKTETGKRNLFKRRRPPSPSNALAKNSKLLDSERVPSKGKTETSISADTVKLKTPFRYKIKKKKPAENKNIKIYLSSPEAQSQTTQLKELNTRKISQPLTNEEKEPYFNGNATSNDLVADQTMEWEPTKEQILRFTRNDTDDGDNEEMMDCQDGISEVIRNEKGGKCIYFVIDTNVLIQSLSLIEKLIKAELRGFAVIIMIPWQVLKELDKLKTIGNHSVAFCARKATKFLSESQNESCNIIFQKQSKHYEDCHQVLVEVPDDQLIKCCCQLKNENKKVILLSNDTNLRVKASATGGFPSVPDSWVTALIQKGPNLSSSELHCFENEPKESLSNGERICAQFLYRLTKCLSSFLFDVIRECFKKKYDELWVLWVPNIVMSLKETVSCTESLTVLEPFKTSITDIWKFYQEHSSYKSIKAIDIEKHGRNCISLAKSIHHLFPEIGSQFDKDMGFLKTGDINESCYGYTSASSMIAQTYFKRMEDKLNSSLNHLTQVVSKIYSQSIVIPDTRDLLNNIDRNLTVTNEASTVFLLMDKDEEIPLNTTEVVIFHKFLLNFLEENQDEYSLPIFSPEDIIMYINRERTYLNPAALHWLSDVRRHFMEYKSVLKEH